MAAAPLVVQEKLMVRSQVTSGRMLLHGLQDRLLAAHNVL